MIAYQCVKNSEQHHRKYFYEHFYVSYETEIEQSSCSIIGSRDKEMKINNVASSWITPEVLPKAPTEDNEQNDIWRTYKPVDLKRHKTNVLIRADDHKKQKLKTDPKRKLPAAVLKALSSNTLANE